jgi:hypothetical protein
MIKQFVSIGNVQVKKKPFLCAMTITNILKGDKKHGRNFSQNKYQKISGKEN